MELFLLILMLLSLNDEDIEILALKKCVNVGHVDIAGVVVDLDRRVFGGFELAVFVLKDFDILTLSLILAKCASYFLNEYLLSFAFLNILILFYRVTAGGPKLLKIELGHRLLLDIRFYILVEIFFFLDQ